MIKSRKDTKVETGTKGDLNSRVRHTRATETEQKGHMCATKLRKSGL